MGTREENRAERRQQALEAARALITQRGLDALSMRKLSARADLAVNTLYSLFGSRDGVLEAIISEGIEHTGATLTRLQSEEPLEDARRVMQLSVEKVLTRPELARPMYCAMSHVSAPQEFALGRAIPIVSGILERAREHGDLRPELEPSLLAEHLLRGFVQTASRWAHEELSDQRFSATCYYSLYVCLLSGATSQGTQKLLPSFEQAQQDLLRSS